VTTGVMPSPRKASEPRGHGVDQKKFARRLLHYRRTKGLSRPGLSELSGVSVRTLEGWEQARREPGAFDLSRVAAVLGIAVEQLVSDAFPDPPAEPSAGPGRPPKPSPPAPPRPGRRKGPKE
jgi:ribosome-binding protein aMBF1 (putative translation factor)